MNTATLAIPMRKIPDKVMVFRQDPAPPFRPAIIALVPAGDPNGDAIAHIPMEDGRTITYREEIIAARMAQAWNGTMTEATYLQLYRACLDMLVITGGSQYWTGDTHEALKTMESVVAKASEELPKIEADLATNA